MSSGERAPEEMVAAVADSVVSGLAAIHARKQLHRDVKPGNVGSFSFTVGCVPLFELSSTSLDGVVLHHFPFSCISPLQQYKHPLS